MNEQPDTNERYLFPGEMLPAIHFEAENMADVADKLNDMVGNYYRDTIGNAFKLTGFYHFQAERVEEWYAAEAGSTQPMRANIAYDVVALPIYEHVEWLSSPKEIRERLVEGMGLDETSIPG